MGGAVKVEEVVQAMEQVAALAEQAVGAQPVLEVMERAEVVVAQMAAEGLALAAVEMAECPGKVEQTTPKTIHHQRLLQNCASRPKLPERSV